MDRLRAHTWTWVLFGTLSWMCLGQATAGPHYFVTIPSILGSGAEVKFCALLLKPNETLAMTVTLLSPDHNTTLYRKESREEFHICHNFMAPIVPEDEVHSFQVEVSGQTFYSRDVRKVMIQVRKPVTFIQTDKPIYLPGQTVHFRVVSLDTQLKPACRKYDSIILEDANNNRIGQWLNRTSDVKILQLSYPLNAEAKEGYYDLIVTSGEEKIYHNFKVEKYVLPKFDVKISTNDRVAIEQETISVQVCARYTYGQPVPGTVKIDVCRPLDRYIVRTTAVTEDGTEAIPEITAPCYKHSTPANKEGCATFTFPMSTFTKIAQKAVQDSLEVFAKMEEEGTGITHTAQKRLSISYVIGTLSFFDVPKVYEKDTTVEGKVKAVRFDGKPLPNMKLYLFEGSRWSSRRLQNLTTDDSGVATFSLDTEGYNGDIRLHIGNKPELGYAGYRVPFYETGQVTLSMVQQSTPDTKTVSSLEVKRIERSLANGIDEDISIDYTVVQEAQGPMDIFYMVIGNNDIIMQGHQEIVVTDNEVTEGSVSFKLQVTADLVPDFVVIAFAVLPSSYVIAHSAEFSTEKFFSHMVELDFDPDQGVPGEDATLHVTGHPNSLCGISVIDQSVLIQEPDKYLKAETIYNLLPRNRFVPYQAQDPTTCLPVRPKRSLFPYPVGRDDAFSVFQNIGLKVATNLMIRVPDCLSYLGREYNQGGPLYAMDRVEQNIAMAAPMGGGMGGAPSPVIETVRTFFPETWIWDLVDIGDSGKADMSVKIPDTITTWETEAFCLSPQGFGLAPRKNFTVFQPFFLELSLPYSIIRGENFELKATVFNYLTSCMMVEVTDAASDEYTLTKLSEASNYKACVCGNERKTLKWTMTPSALGSVNVTVSAEAVPSDISCNNEIVQVPEKGRKDTVTKQLIVKAEGLEMIDTYNLLLCPKGDALSEDIAVQLPENVIVGSARAMVSVIGSILGRAMNNLDGLLRMPYGCGEQNMALFAPNTYILEYLTNTNQLTPEIEEKAEWFLSMGYQRQLNYKHSDGAYSTFGVGAGNTWLTAFVLRSFGRARKFIYIDPTTIEESRQWLESKQMPNGCFRKIGNLFNNRMKGGVSDEVTLTAYISAAMLELEVAADNPVLVKSLNCLKTSMGTLSNTYTTALMSYVFTLAKNSTVRDQLLSHLDSVAQKGGGLLHLSQTSAETSASLSVEMSAYLLLAKLGTENPSATDLGYAAQIVRWLIKQQNYYGGFSSTQDTVVALQALTRYATLVHSPEGQSTVTVTPPSSAQLIFEVNKDNKLLYQERSITDRSGTYTVEVKGNTCAAVQIAVMYNIPVPTEAAPFSLTVTPENDCKSNLQRARTSLTIKAKYLGKEEVSNMVVIDLKLLSGFIVDSDSLKALKLVDSVERVDQDGDHVLIYLEKAQKDVTLTYKLDLIQDRIVQNLKPAVVKVYDYYQPSDKVETEYAYKKC